MTTRRVPTPRARRIGVICALTLLASRAHAQSAAVVPPATQNPSPMVEHTRVHGRLPETPPPGTRRTFAGPLGKPVEVFLPPGGERAATHRLVIHFHGAAFIPEISIAGLGPEYVSAAVTLGAGSGVYDRTFSDPAVYDSLVADITRAVTAMAGHPVTFERVTLVGFSAGHGAIRAILREPRHFARVDAVLLLDGLHTGYVPDGTVVEKGGTLDPSSLETIVRYARAATRGEKAMLVTHSEIFPGTFASTTETTDYLVAALGLSRTPVLQWGPHGMQQLSTVKRGRLEIMGFAGNSAPDHIDHFHGMPEFLARLEKS